MGPVSRRTFLKDLGRGTLAVAILGIGAAACAAEQSTGTSSEPVNPTTPTSEPPATTTTTPEATTSTPSAGSGGVEWERVVLGSVSAYLLVRSGEVAIVDTGNPGSGPSIEATLAGLGSQWADVSHVILTHLHRDHVGSLGEVMAAAPESAGFAGAPDIPSISSPRPLAAVGDGDSVFGLEIIATPGHTPGSISVFDREAAVLVAGDALNGVDGGIGGANPRFSSDMAEADASVRKLAGFEVDTALFGHGEPVVGGAGALLTELAANL